jgi:catechol 2,3-dioxygenase
MTPTLQLKHVALRVRDLARSREYYVRRIGIVALGETTDRVELAAALGSPPILTLLEGADGIQPRNESAGLFHAALLFPSRTGLASWLSFANTQRIEFDGISDHGVSEAIYCRDPTETGWSSTSIARAQSGHTTMAN